MFINTEAEIQEPIRDLQTGKSDPPSDFVSLMNFIRWFYDPAAVIQRE